MKRTSDGLIDLLLRNGVKPTGDSVKDIELAKKFMPTPYKGLKNKKGKVN